MEPENSSIDSDAATRQGDRVDLLCCDGKTVVEGEEHMRFMNNRISNAPVDLAPSLQKTPYIFIQQTPAELPIKISKNASRNHNQI